MVSLSIDINDSGFEEELEVGRPHRIAVTSPAILDVAPGERLNALLTAFEDAVDVTLSILKHNNSKCFHNSYNQGKGKRELTCLLA